MAKKNKRRKSNGQAVKSALRFLQHPKALNPARTKTGKVPQGRTITTNDNFLGEGKKTGSTAEHPAVVIEANDNNELAIVPLSSKKGPNKTNLPNYQQGQTRFKHFVEIEDDEGNPIVINEKFRENHPNMDISREDVAKIVDKVLNHCKASSTNRQKLNDFRNRKK